MYFLMTVFLPLSLAFYRNNDIGYYRNDIRSCCLYADEIFRTLELVPTLLARGLMSRVHGRTGAPPRGNDHAE